MFGLNEISTIGSGLHRPECVLATGNGRLYAADWRGGVSIIEPGGQQWSLLAKDAGFDVKPNGIALMPDGSFLLAHLGDQEGGVYRLAPDGALTPFCVEVDGQALPPTNYPHLDSQGRIWITVSTRHMPRAAAYRGDVSDGFIILVDRGEARIVADGLGYTNECLVYPDGTRLFVNETFARRLSSFDIAPDGSLSNKQVIAEFGEGTFPDGLTFDEQGGTWVTSIVSNRVIHISIEGEQTLFLEDVDPDRLRWVEDAFQEKVMGRPHLDQAHGSRLQNISSLAFGGPDLRTIYLGCLLGDHISSVKSPVAGYPPVHWNYAGPLQSLQTAGQEVAYGG